MSRRDDMGGIEPVTIDGKGHRFLIIEAPYYEDVAAAHIERIGLDALRQPHDA